MSLSIFSNHSKIKFADIYSAQGMIQLEKIFNQFLADHDSDLAAQLADLKQNPEKFNAKDEANILIELAKILEKFLIEIFGIEQENEKLRQIHQNLSIIYQIKKDFIQRQVAKKFKAEDVAEFTPEGALQPNQDPTKFELEFAKKVQDNLENEAELKALGLYAAWALFNPEGQKAHQNGTLFRLPKKIDFENLVNWKPELKERDGFKLTDHGYNLNQVLGEANYCIFCHNQGKDSCSKGLREKDSKQFKKDFFGEELEGCPLEEKISEMNLLKSQGFSLAALAIAAVDNPMIAGTGHRICNDCMKSCIYQKQDPVDIPQIESRVLKDVLNLPYGFEIYSLLTRFNPLNLKNPITKNDSGYKVLVAGLGPAGFTLAHHLLNEGHLVVAIDGLKIEPLNPEISGIDLDGNRQNFRPIKNIQEIFEELDTRPVYGFGGVAEYGITSRWDKNYLKIIRLLLERRANFRMLGGTRLGSAFDCHDALNDLSFDHVALCLGAGWPGVLNIKNIFAKGVRSASDFLMALQLTGAMHPDLVTNLQVRLPVLVVGAGLTAIDTACEALAYYVLQVENFARRHQILCQKIGQRKLEKTWNEEERLIAAEFLDHAKQIKLAKERGESVTKLLQKWGGAKLVTRKNIKESPSYKTNHLEIEKALEEGIEIIDEATPREVIIDKFGHIEFLKVHKDGEDLNLKSRALFIAIGTSPNKAPAYEDKLEFGVENNSFKVIDLNGNHMAQQPSPKSENIGFLAAKDEKNHKTVSFFGDTHLSFSGSVVKAMASAKKGFPTINKSLEILEKNHNYQEFLSKINQQFSVKVKELNLWSENIFELKVEAPILAKHTKLGHIFRLQNYHALAAHKGETKLGMEGVAVTVYEVEPDLGLISVVVINTGGSSSIVKNLKIGENIIFMGPSGTPNHIAENKNVVFLAAGRGVFPLASLGQAHKNNGCKVTLFCGFRKNSDLVNLEKLQKSCDNLVLSFEEKPQIKPSDKIKIFHGDLVEAFVAFAKQNKGEIDLDYSKIDLIFTMGNEEMMDKIAKARHLDLKNELKEAHIGITSLNNPMQCMLKGVCSQCLQKKTDAKTGAVRYFYSCIAQDQKMDEVDFDFLKNRCNQNSLLEKLTKNWLQSI